MDAIRATALVDSLGVNTHIDFQTYGYQNFTVIEASIKYLGLANLRDDPENPADVGPNGWWQQVADATGAKFDAFLAEGSVAQMQGDLTRAQQLGGQGILSAIEGGNEEDDPYAQQNGNSLAAAAQEQQQVYSVAHSLGLPAINMSFGQGWTAANNWHGNYDKVGNLAPYADYANAHTYAADAPASTIAMLNADAQIAAVGRPVMQTEFGYDTSVTDPVTAAKYSLDGVLDSYLAGDVKTYFYALFDDGSGNFGLMNQDGTAKPAGKAIHDLTTLLADPGAEAGTFTLGSLPITLDGTVGGDQHLLMQKSDGSYWLSVWNEQQGLGASHSITVNLGITAASVQEFDPLTGISSAQSVSNASSVTLTVPDHPVLVEIVPGTTTPPPSQGGEGGGGAPPPTSGSAALGAYVGVPDEDDASAQAAVTAQWNAAVKALDQTPTMMDTFVDLTLPESQWVGDAQWEADSWAATPWAKGLTPVIGVPMASQGESADASFKAIASGSEDSIFTGIFQAWADAGYHTQYIRPGWEMNGDWQPWAITPSNAADFKAAFQHIATLAHDFSGADIKVVWNPNEGGTPVPVAQYYPGASSVDVIGLDDYGPPVSQDYPSDPSTSSSTFTLDQALAFAKAQGKPFALPETGGTDAAFPAALANEVAQSGDQMAFVNLWDVNDGSGNLSWSGDPTVSAAWKQAVQTIQGSVPPPPVNDPPALPTSDDLALTVPGQETVAAGKTITVTGISIDDAWAQTAGGTMALNVYDSAGTLGIDGKTFAPGGDKVANGMIAGTEDQLNAALAGLTYTAGPSGETDTLYVDVWNQAGVEVTKGIAVTTTAETAPPPPPPPTLTSDDLVVAVPSAVDATADISAPIKGISITDPWAAQAGGTMALNVYDKLGTIQVDGQTFGPGGGKVPFGMVAGTLDQLNADLAGLTYTGPAGTDTLTIDVWNQAGVEATKTIAVTVKPPSNPVVTLDPSNPSPTVTASNSTINGTGTFAAYIGGSGDTVSVSGGNESMMLFGGKDAVTTGSGNDTIYVASAGNTISTGGGQNTIIDSTGGNTITLPGSGSYLDLWGAASTSADTLDFRPLLAGTSWNGDAATFGKYVHVGTALNGTDALISVSPTAGGSGTAVATLHGAAGVSLATLQTHAIMPSGT